MSSTWDVPRYLRVACWLTQTGGILIVLVGFLYIGEAVLLPSLLESVLPGATALVTALGVVAVILGLAIIALGVRVKSSPGSTRTSGILIIVLSLFSLIGGGGLFIGLILALVGGIMATTWRPPMLSPPAYGATSYGTPTGPPSATLPWGSPDSPPLPPGVPLRCCSSCGSPNVATARFCAKCGAPTS